MNSKVVCMIVQDPNVKGGISAVINGYRNSSLEKDYNIIYVESYKDGNRFSKFLKALLSYIIFCKVLLVNKPNIIHIHSSFGASFYRKAPFIYLSKLANKPIINHCHGADFDNFYTKASKRKKKFIRKIYNKCSTLIALSEEWKEKLSEIIPVEKIKVLENYSMIHSEYLQERLSRKSNNQILFLGEIGHRKGSYDLPSVVEELSKLMPNFKLIMAGDGDIDGVKDLLREKKVSQHVLFPGWVRGEEKNKMLRESDVFILPSYNEGMPMAILDAMGYGLPIISTEVGGIPKIVVNDLNGYVFRPGDTKGFAKAIHKLLDNDLVRKQMNKESLSIVEDNYSLDTHLSKLKSTYKEHLISTNN